MNRVLLRSVSLLVLASAGVYASAQTGFYGGDPNSAEYLLGETSTFVFVTVFEDFNLGTATSVQSVFGNYVFSDGKPDVSALHYEIRQGSVESDGGTLLFMGDVAATVVANGVSGQGEPVYTVSAALSGVTLGPGSYYLGLSAYRNVESTAYLVATDGAGGSGSLANNSLFRSGAFGDYVHTGGLYAVGSPDRNYSMGLNGTAILSPVPGPAAVGPFALGALAILRKRRRKS